jgi:vesicle-associated membrane protein 7
MGRVYHVRVTGLEHDGRHFIPLIPLAIISQSVMIVYAVICRSRDAAVLAENYSPELGGNAPQVTLALMERLRDCPEYLPNGESKTFAQRNEEADFFAFTSFLEACTGGANTALADHFFHVMHDGTIFFSCLSDDPDPRSHAVCFLFLHHAKDEFRSLYKERKIEKANAYGLNKDFGPHLRSAMHYYNTNREKLARDAQVADLQDQIESMKMVMGRNINLLLQKGEQLDMLVDKSNQMMDDTSVFKKRSGQLKSQMRWRYYKSSCLCSVLAFVAIWFFLSCACGFNFSRCIPDNSSSNGGG